jgi:hypothetical protein
MAKAKGIRLVKNKTITKELIPDKLERKFNSKTDVVPKKINNLIAMVFREDKGAKLLVVNRQANDFVHNGHLYFLNPEATYITDNGNRMAFYLEGVSTPMSHSNIEKQLVKVKYKDLDGTLKEKVVMKIKGLKYDSRILQLFTDRKFAEVFTKIGIDKWAFYTFICLMVVIGIGVANCIVSYWFK